MSRCDFVFVEVLPNGKQRWKCDTCGGAIAFSARNIRDGKPVQTSCPQGAPMPAIAWASRAQPKRPAQPSLIAKTWNFAKATAKDLLNGRKRRTQAEVAKLLEVCQGCEFYRAGKNSEGDCSKCGCPLVRAVKFRNKLAILSERCPVGKW